MRALSFPNNFLRPKGQNMHPTDNDDAPSNATAAIQMPRYQSFKKVWALEIDSVDGLKMTFRDKGYAPIEVKPEVFSRYTPIPGDYYVVYNDGYKSISPRQAFLEGYYRIIP